MTISPLSPVFGTKIMAPEEVVTIDSGIAPRKKPLVIYHGNCADGFGAAWCFYHANPEGYEFHAGKYGETPPDCTDRVVFLVDFSYKREIVKQICAVAFSVTLIDHHKTAIEDLVPLSDKFSSEFQANFKAITDINRSGAMLAWDYLFNNEGLSFAPFPGSSYYNPPPLLLGHIQDRDLWQFKLVNTREISAALFSYEYDFAIWDVLMKGNQTDLLKLSAAGAAIERKHHKDIAELVKVCQRTMTIGDYDVPVASLPYTLTSDAGHLMASMYREGAIFAACYWDTANERIFSLRSADNGLDVSLIAVNYGGGGHKNAAGFKVPRNHPLATM